ncbi:MAG: endonuclease NucS [Proteobacteria bacterium]|nr:endonuclease NucS [Pseudomonadota bacterium]
MKESDFESILAKYPDLVEDGLILVGQQVTVFGRRIDLLFEDKFKRKLIVELKAGPIKDEHIGQILSYEGMLLSADNQDIRVMLIGTRVPPNIQKSLDHHGIAWREIKAPYLKDSLADKGDDQFNHLFEDEIDPPRMAKNKTVSSVPGDSQRGDIMASNGATLREVKIMLGEKYIKDEQQKYIYINKANQFKQWANYIAALYLTEVDGFKVFQQKDVKRVLRDNLLPDHYDRPGAKESALCVADVELESPYHGGYPCLKKISGNLYQFVGFSLVIETK